MTIEETIWQYIAPRMREIIREEVQAQFDEPVTKKYIMDLFGVSLATVDNWIKKGIIKRINPEGGHPKFSRNQIMNLKNRKL